MIEVDCFTYKQKAKLQFRPKTQDYILLEHYTRTHIKCATSNEVYSSELAERLFRGRKR